MVQLSSVESFLHHDHGVDVGVHVVVHVDGVPVLFDFRKNRSWAFSLYKYFICSINLVLI